MRYLYAIILCFFISVATEADLDSTTSISANSVIKTVIDYADQIQESRKTGSWVVVKTGHLFELANLFFPDRSVARMKFIQDVVKLNSGYFSAGKMRTLLPGIVLRLPGYVMIATDTVPADMFRQGALPASDPVDSKIPVDSTIGTGINTETETTLKYADQYMESSELEALNQILSKQPAGRRSLDAEYYYYNNKGSDNSHIEQGLNLGFKRETLQSGNLFVKSSFQHLNNEIQNSNDDEYDWLIKLGQTDLPIGNRWLMDNTLGQQRSLPDAFLLGGYRYRLPGSPMAGISGRLRSDNTQYKWYAGNTGDYQGVSSRRFEEDGGKTAALFMQHDLSSTLSVGGALSGLNNHDQIEDHNSMLGAMGFRTTETQHNLRILLNDDGNMAVWNDNLHSNVAGWRMRYGAFHAEPELKWNDSAIASDQQGLYAQATTQKQKLELSLGYDFQEFGLKNNSPESSNTHSGFANSLYRVNRTVNTGITTSFSKRNYNIISGSNIQHDSFSISQFIKVRSLTGVTSLDLFYSQTDTTDRTNNSHTQGLNLRRNWQLPLHQSLELEFRVEQTDSEQQSDEKMYQTSLYYSNDWLENLSWDANLTAFQNQNYLAGGINNHNNGVHIGLSASWQITPQWHSRLILDTGKTSTPDSDPFAAGEQRTETISVTLGYSQYTGRRFQYVGRRSSSRATGKIRGIIFFDENRDGLRQYDEKLAGNVRILLDGKYEIFTNNKGEYEYYPVYIGIHTMGIVIEDLPLPWTLEDENSISIQVNSRQTTKVNFPLIKI